MIHMREINNVFFYYYCLKNGNIIDNKDQVNIVSKKDTETSSI